MVWLAMSSETLEITPPLLLSDTQSLVGFPPIAKYVTMNELNGYLTFNSVLAPLRLFAKMRETNKGGPILSAAEMFIRKSSRKSSLLQ